MEVSSTNLKKWESELGGRESAGPAAVEMRSLSSRSEQAFAARIKFLTADGQSATRLEQEALLGTNDLVEASFLDRCLLVSRCVGRIRFTRPSGRGYATGFLIAPGLVITNHHVFPEVSAASSSSIEFDYRYDVAGQIGQTSEFGLLPANFFIANEELDFAVVAVSPTSTASAALADRGYLRLNPQSGKVEQDEFVTILEHPDGAPLQIALRENRVIRAAQDESVIWYQADTAHGSSGAPVFNDSFQVAALHSSGRIKRNSKGEVALRRGGWTASMNGLSESDVVWEANVGIRISRIAAKLLELARDSFPDRLALLQAAMKEGDVLSASVAQIRSGIAKPQNPATSPAPGGEAEAEDRLLTVPLELRIRFGAQGTPREAGVALLDPKPASDAPPHGSALETESFAMRIPVIYDELDKRTGFDRKFLKLPSNANVPMPALTAAGKKVAAALMGSTKPELKYHKFSLWMQKERRLALFTACNVEWAGRKPVVDGKKTDRDTLAGFPPDAKLAEQWVSDPRISPRHQLPDIFYSEDKGAFDKGHLVRRDDVCWGTSFTDIQKANGDTYHVTNCSPQIAAFNRGTEGVGNWGDLESTIQSVTKKAMERAVVFAGPIFRPDDRWFRGRDELGPVRVQIPSRFWKIVVTLGKKGPQAFGFVLEQDVRSLTEKEFSVDSAWIGSTRAIAAIEADLRGWISLAALKPFNQFKKMG